MRMILLDSNTHLLFFEIDVIRSTKKEFIYHGSKAEKFGNLSLNSYCSDEAWKRVFKHARVGLGSTLELKFSLRFQK